MHKIDVLAIGVHPDDIELGAGGTVARHLDLGYSVGYLDLTQGELGTRGTPELRLQEANQAAQVLNVDFRLNLGLADGFFTLSKAEKIKIVEVIRWCQPEIILANALQDRHPDHGRAAQLVYESIFLSGLKSIQTQYQGEEQVRWRPKATYHYIQDFILEPDVVVDISDYFDLKMQAIKSFQSQFYQAGSKELDSPLTNKDYFDQIEGRARSLGRQIGVEFAEGFNTRRNIGVKDLIQLL